VQSKRLPSLAVRAGTEAGSIGGHGQRATHNDRAGRSDVGLEAQVDGGAVGRKGGHRARKRVRHWNLRMAHSTAMATIEHSVRAKLRAHRLTQ